MKYNIIDPCSLTTAEWLCIVSLYFRQIDSEGF